MTDETMTFTFTPRPLASRENARAQAVSAALEAAYGPSVGIGSRASNELRYTNQPGPSSCRSTARDAIAADITFASYKSRYAAGSASATGVPARNAPARLTR